MKSPRTISMTLNCKATQRTWEYEITVPPGTKMVARKFDSKFCMHCLGFSGYSHYAQVVTLENTHAAFVFTHGTRRVSGSGRITRLSMYLSIENNLRSAAEVAFGVVDSIPQPDGNMLMSPTDVACKWHDTPDYCSFAVVE